MLGRTCRGGGRQRLNGSVGVAQSGWRERERTERERERERGSERERETRQRYILVTTLTCGQSATRDAVGGSLLQRRSM